MSSLAYIDSHASSRQQDIQDFVDCFLRGRRILAKAYATLAANKVGRTRAPVQPPPIPIP